ncbi:MAG: glycosyltransferase [Planctomycetes bacterium]|nr:glycosyltransferase [Planctomycetota bacterium]
MTELSVIIPVYNRPDDLAVLLASLAPELPRLEVIVVDDATPDAGAYDALRRAYPAVRFLRQERNRGPAAARNRGAREASCELLFFVDSDTAVVPGTVDSILRIYREHPGFVACGGTSDDEPLNPGLFSAYKALLETSWVLDRRGRITTIGHLGSRAFTIRRSVMLALGGFDETLATPDVEDYEFGYRLRDACGPIPFCPEIRVRHRYDTLMTQARLYFRRVILWWHLRHRGGGADAVGSTWREAAVAASSTVMTLAALAAPWQRGSAWVAAGFAAAALGLNQRFLRLCLARRGPAFTLLAFALHTFLSWFICAGAAVAMIQAPHRLAPALRGRRGGVLKEHGIPASSVAGTTPAGAAHATEPVALPDDFPPAAPARRMADTAAARGGRKQEAPAV